MADLSGGRLKREITVSPTRRNDFVMKENQDPEEKEHSPEVQEAQQRLTVPYS